MREIKFRSWIDYLDDPNMEYFTLENRVKQYCSDSCMIMQYTDRKDKNEKEIYEHDICTAFVAELVIPFRCVIGFENSGFVINATIKNTATLYLSDIEMIEVIGNKFENPELL